MVYKSLHGLAPDYMHSMFVNRDSVNPYSLRTTENKLTVPKPHTNYLKYKRVPKNFEQFQTCDFPHRLRKLTKNRRLVNFFEEIRFFWQTQFDCLHKYHFYIKSMQDSTKNSKYAKSIYRSV